MPLLARGAGILPSASCAQLPAAVNGLGRSSLGHADEEIEHDFSQCQLHAAIGWATLAGKVVDIYDFPDGRLEIPWRGLPLSYSVFDPLLRVSHAAIIENKRLGEVLA